jgi:hypothetical protein
MRRGGFFDKIRRMDKIEKSAPIEHLKGRPMLGDDFRTKIKWGDQRTVSLANFPARTGAVRLKGNLTTEHRKNGAEWSAETQISSVSSMVKENSFASHD